MKSESENDRTFDQKFFTIFHEKLIDLFPNHRLIFDQESNIKYYLIVKKDKIGEKGKAVH